MSGLDYNKSFLQQSILIVEDDPVILGFMEEMLDIYFKKVYTAKDGFEALKVFNDNNLDLILCDIKMPNLNGIETIKRIRKDNYNIPVIILSGFYDNEILLEVLNLNILGYTIKPILSDDIKEILKKLYLYQNNNIEVDIKKIDENIFFDKKNCQLFIDKEIISLTKKEVQFVELLLNKRGSVVSYDIIEQTIWFENNEIMSSSSLRTLVKNVRKKLSKNDLIENISKVGYKIV